MPLWFILALAAPMLWAITNHIDKFVVSQYTEDKKAGALVLFSALISGVVASFIFYFAAVEHLFLYQRLAGMLAGAFLIAGYIPYMYALQEDEVSIAAPLFQMIAPMSYAFGAIFLHESLSSKQILAGFLIIIGAVLMTLNFERFAWKARIFKLMFFSCLLIALNTLVFKKIGLESSFWTVSLWEYLGAFVFGIFLLFLPSYRKDFKGMVVEGGSSIFGLNILSETINIIARLFSKFATLLVPIALISIMGSTQPFFVFLYGIILFLFFPKIQKEDFSRKTLLLKLSAIFVMIIGSSLLFL
jgi:drug/metabolite transporter (DMT)-like permease